MANKTIVFNTTKYNFSWIPRKISESTKTIPDMVLSMAEIYRKYLVTRDISSLPGKSRPYSFDNGSEFDDSFEPEEMVDTLQHTRYVQQSFFDDQDQRSRQQDKGPSGPEDKPQNEEGANAPSPKPPISQVSSDQPNAEELSDEK